MMKNAFAWQDRLIPDNAFHHVGKRRLQVIGSLLPESDTQTSLRICVDQKYRFSRFCQSDPEVFAGRCLAGLMRSFA